MNISFLKLENFRNYESLEIGFNSRINLFYGYNGQGKTNLLESLFLCSVGKSFRTTKDTEMIKNDKEYFFLKVLIENDLTDSITINYDKKKQKAISVNGMYLRKTGQLMGSLLTVLFCPEDMLLLSEGPSQRRRFLNIAISQLNPLYYYDLQQYDKILLQKNIQLKDCKYNSKELDMLCVWNEQLSEYGSRILFERFKYIKILKEIAKQKHSVISDEKEELNISYDNSIDCSENYSIKEIKDSYNNTLNKITKREIERETSLVGPHRDDITFNLNDMDLKKYGSQGQKRTAVLSLKISEIDIMKMNTGRSPILLLDDVLSELDKKRQKALLNSLNGIQTFITSVDKDAFNDFVNDSIEYFNINDGHVYSSKI